MHQMISKLDDCNAANMQIFSIRVITFFLTYIDLVVSFNRQSIQMSVDSHHQLIPTPTNCDEADMQITLFQSNRQYMI